jgi:hypothetical protein
MEHFIAYHSARTMGYEMEPSDSGELRFLSRKLGLLKKAIGSTVWVVQGIPEGKNTTYSLCGAYIADHIDIEADPYVISGPSVKEFSPFIRLNDLSWFPALKKSQSNFSLGFNRINDETVVQALVALQANSSPSPITTFPDIDLFTTGTEGATRFVYHLHRERNRAIVEAKKSTALNATGHLCCEVGGFDFSATYGALGDGFCEVHHLVPLSALTESVTTTLDDLAILCSNCHRIIHRASPMLSIAELSRVVAHGRP